MSQSETETDYPYELPEKRLGPGASVKNPDDANAALVELGCLDWIEAETNARRELAKQQVDQVYDEALFVPVGERQESIARRRDKLEAGLLTYVNAQHPHLKSGGDGKRTLKLEYGELSWVKGRDAIQFAREKKQADVFVAVDRALEESAADDEPKSLRERIVGWLKRVRFAWDGGTKPVSLIVDLNPTIKRSEILKRFEAGKLTAELLAKFCLRFVAGEDEFRAKPKPWQGRPR